jgi:hypothetical protein
MGNGIVSSVVYAQIPTMFLDQGITLYTGIGSFNFLQHHCLNIMYFNIPPASLSKYHVLSVMIWASVYDWIIVPIVCKHTGKVEELF